MRHILAVTGIRSDYDLMTPVFSSIEAHPDLRLSLIVTGAHLSKTFGNTVEQIEKDGFEIAEKIETLIDGDRDVSRVRGAGLQLGSLAQAVDRIRPDILLVLGDREESITTALVSCYMNIPLAHVGGGDRVVGNADDQVRHAVSKLAHFHFVTSTDSEERLVRSGEQPFRVKNCGNPGLDRFRQVPELSRADLYDWLGFEQTKIDEPLLVLIQHVISSEIDDAYRQMEVTLRAVEELGWNTVLSYPNSDAGGKEMIRCIGDHQHITHLRCHKNIPRLEFVNLLRHARCLMGNSSCGLLEAPFFHLPVINIGNRQKMRFQAGNVKFVKHEINEIVLAVKEACLDENYREEIASQSCPFGDGQAGERIADVLAKVKMDQSWRIKDLSY